MLFTLFFLTVCLTRKKLKNTDEPNDEVELFEIENILNNSHNSEFYEVYWSKVYYELLYLCILFFGLCICIVIDINYMFFGE